MKIKLTTIMTNDEKTYLAFANNTRITILTWDLKVVNPIDIGHYTVVGNSIMCEYDPGELTKVSWDHYPVEISESLLELREHLEFQMIDLGIAFPDGYEPSPMFEANG